jgi:hypothetical protein
MAVTQLNWVMNLLRLKQQSFAANRLLMYAGLLPRPAEERCWPLCVVDMLLLLLANLPRIMLLLLSRCCRACSIVSKVQKVPSWLSLPTHQGMLPVITQQMQQRPFRWILGKPDAPALHNHSATIFGLPSHHHGAEMTAARSFC